MMFVSASFMSGSNFPMVSIAVCLLAGEASIGVTSTNSLPPAVRMVAGVVNSQKDKPNGFIASVIICE